MRKIMLFVLLITTFAYSQEYGTGLVLNKRLYNQIALKPNILMKGDLPSSISLKKYTPDVNSQGHYGTCVGWSTGWALRTTIEAINNNWTNKEIITNNSFSPLFVYFNASGGEQIECNKGTSLYSAFNTLKDYGTPYYKDFPDMCVSEVPKAIYDKAKYHKIKDFNRLFDYKSDNSIKVEKVKQSIANKKPVTIGILCPNSFQVAKNVWEPIENTADIESGHAITVIGYDDNKYGGAFEIMNSWGTDWGNNGYMWIRYTDFPKYTFEAVEAILEAKDYLNILRGSIKLISRNGEAMNVSRISGINSKGSNTVKESEIADYSMNKPLYSGDKYKMLVTSDKPSYIYVFGADLNNNNSILFPNKDEISAYIDYKGAGVPIPNDGYWIQLDNNKGVDFVIVIFSTKELNSNDILSKMNSINGSIDEKISGVISNNIIDKDNVTLQNDKIKFEAKSKNKNAVAIVIKMQHN